MIKVVNFLLDNNYERFGYMVYRYVLELPMVIVEDRTVAFSFLNQLHLDFGI